MTARRGLFAAALLIAFIAIGAAAAAVVVLAQTLEEIL